MLQRFTQVGEFYVMTTPEGVGEADTLVGFMDVLVYDEESDRHVKISYRSALEATGLFDVGAAPNTTVALKGGIDDKPLSDNDANGATMILSEYAAAAAILLAANEKPGSKVTGAGLKGAPIVLARPFIEHAMLSAVLTVSGGDTGATIFGPSDMQISANTSVKTIEGCACLFEPTTTPTPHTHFNAVALGPYRGHILQVQRRPEYYGSSRTLLGVDRCLYVASCRRSGAAERCSLQTDRLLED